MKRGLVRVTLVLATVALLGVPLLSSQGIDLSSVHVFSVSNVSSGQIEGVPYVWQEVNGFCYWSSVDMAIRYVGIDLDLHRFFAASGIGFSAAYLMLDDTQLFISGSTFRQQQQLPIIAELLGLDYTAYFDSNSEWINLVAPLWADSGVNMELLNGSIDAFSELRAIIDDGYPAVIWVDPYWLPAIDYVQIRPYITPQDPAAPASGHAIVITGYNDTSATVDILDPGVGAFGQHYGYPSDGRYHYIANYSTLDTAWKTLGYGTVVFKLGVDPVQDQEQRIGRFIADRLLGNRTSYAPELEDVFFASFGEAAFRGLSLDTTITGISDYLDQFDSADDKSTILRLTGATHEMFMTLQYISYRSALEALPSLLPSYDLFEVLEAGRQAYPYMESLSANASLVDLAYELNGSLLTTTYNAIAQSYEQTNNVGEALQENAHQIEALASSLLSIADSWKAAGEALERVLESPSNLPGVLLGVVIFTAGIIIAIVIFQIRRR